VDVFLDTFEMSHTLDPGARLETEPRPLAAADWGLCTTVTENLGAGCAGTSGPR
jgi:hypothetical protein